MARTITRRLTYGNVIATLALFIALGGTSYAVNEISSRNVKNNSLTSADVRNNSLTGGDIRDRSLTAADFRGSLPAGATGPAGPRGLAGPAGPAGPAGAASAAGAAGAKGAKGDNGDRGDKGDKGDKGEAGDIFTASALPSGRTLRGAWNVGGTSTATDQNRQGPISYPVPLAADPNVIVVQEGATPPANCPGTATDPKAAPGFLCVFVGFNSTSNGVHWYGTDGDSITRFGVAIYVTSSGAGTTEATGTWAVTAP